MIGITGAQTILTEGGVNDEKERLVLVDHRSACAVRCCQDSVEMI